MWERKGLERYENEKHILFCRSTIIKNGNRSTRMKIENQEQEKIKKKKRLKLSFLWREKTIRTFSFTIQMASTVTSILFSCFFSLTRGMIWQRMSVIEMSCQIHKKIRIDASTVSRGKHTHIQTLKRRLWSVILQTKARNLYLNW